MQQWRKTVLNGFKEFVLLVQNIRMVSCLHLLGNDHTHFKSFTNSILETQMCFFCWKKIHHIIMQSFFYSLKFKVQRRLHSKYVIFTVLNITYFLICYTGKYTGKFWVRNYFPFRYKKILILRKTFPWFLPMYAHI